MTFNKYQDAAGETAKYPYRGKLAGLIYTALGLGESGESQGKVKKLLRDRVGEDAAKLIAVPVGDVLTSEDKLALARELGDQLWYISEVASNIGYDLEVIAKMNIAKLKDRAERGVIQGSGDNR